MGSAVLPFARDEHSFRIGVLRCLNACFARIYHHVDVRTPCLLPRTGPAILVCNHISGLDPVMIQSACPRLIRWMMAREFYEPWGLKWICDSVGAIPVDRSGRDLAATRAGLNALEAGYVLGVFPEGKISPDRQILPFQSGISLLAAKSSAPIYPAYLEGTQRDKPMLQAYFLAQRASLTFGPPLHVDRAHAAAVGFEQAANEVRNAVENLRIKELNRRKNQCLPPPAAAHSC